jgi:hypothetical protein
MQTQTPKTPKLVVSKKAIIVLSSLQIVAAFLAGAIQVKSFIDLWFSTIIQKVAVNHINQGFTTF